MILRTTIISGLLILLIACGNNQQELSVNDGIQKIWHENGELHGMGNYSSDLPEGLWMFWNEDGSPWEEGYFVEGKRHGVWKMYDEKGRVISIINYKAGVKNGVYIEYDYKNGVKREWMMKDNTHSSFVRHIELYKDTLYTNETAKIIGDYNHFTNEIE